MWQVIVCSVILSWMTMRAVRALPAGMQYMDNSRPLHIQLPHPGQPANLIQQQPQQQQYAPHGSEQMQPNMVASGSYDSYSSYGGGGGGGGGGNYNSYGGDNYGFDCYGKKPAYYGDGSYDCKIYHVCQADGRSDTFHCPKWTRFNNYLGICDWHFKVDSYCNPLYKEDSYGSSSYGSGSQGGSGY